MTGRQGTREEWQSSMLGMMAADIDARHTRIWPMVKDAGELASDESMLVPALIANAEDKFLEGKDAEAAEELVTAAVTLGLLARYSAEAIQGVQTKHARLPRSKERLARIEDARNWRRAGQDWSDIVNRLCGKHKIGLQTARKDCIAAGRPEQNTTRRSR